MANEFFRHFGADVAITISPRGQGIMEVFINGERVFDKKGEGNIYPDLSRVRQIMAQIRERIETLEPAPADD